MKRLLVYVFAAALAVNFAAGIFYGLDKPMESDAALYLQIAQSVADGDGYKFREGFWPDQPTMSRAPGWPLVVAGALRLQHRAWSIGPQSCDGAQQRAPVMRRGAAEVSPPRADPPPPQADKCAERLSATGGSASTTGGQVRGKTEDCRPNKQSTMKAQDEASNGISGLRSQVLSFPLCPASIMRLVCLLLNALNAVLVFLLTWTLTRNNRMSLIAGALYLFYPTALYYAVTGASEILFITLTMGGVILWQVASGKWQVWGGHTGEDHRPQTIDHRPWNGREKDSFGSNSLSRVCGIYGRALHLVLRLVLRSFSVVASPAHAHMRGEVASCRKVRRTGLRSMVSLCVFGSLLLGLAVTVRINYVILPVMFLLLYISRKSYRLHVTGCMLQENIGDRVESTGQRAEKDGLPHFKFQPARNDFAIGDAGGVFRQERIRFWRTGLLCLLLFCLPVSLWAVRNWKVSGEFPVLSTLRGQTLYGGNNEIVAGPGKFWGYWIFPDGIPGERTMRELAATMSELEVDRYYTGRAKEYLKNNYSKLPVMLTGKMIRAYVPIPWSGAKELLLINGYRLVLYILILMGAVRCWRMMPYGYKLMALSFAAVNLFTVLGFWGCARFAFSIEPLFLPLAGWGIKKTIDPPSPLYPIAMEGKP